MRLLLLIAFAATSLTPSSSAAESIAPGMELDKVTQILERHNYEVNSIKYGLAIAPRNPKLELEFCRIDENITLVITYARDSREVQGMAVYFHAGNPFPKEPRIDLVREALEIGFEKDGIYTLKLKRRDKNGRASSQ